MNRACIISGEASETDSDDDKLPPILPSPVEGILIAKRASETDSDDASVSSAVSALTLDINNAEPFTNSLLQLKLKESNGKLYNDLTTLWQHVLDDAGKNLATIDQNLIKSQLVVQNGATSLKSVASNTVRIKSKLQYLLSAQFIPNIKLHD